MIPIRITSCLCDELPLLQLQSLPAKDWIGEVNNEEAWTEVAKGIEEVIEEVQELKEGRNGRNEDIYSRKFD